ncbi:Ptprm [Bugula neritina]|uniref:Ptprm n=1 Tax=Bugula neritina TaxID=10212 RepID=A0A7J7J5L5_BUGNE|nr:Ptprm [Bugula neritina]
MEICDNMAGTRNIRLHTLTNPYQLQVDSNSVIKNYKETSHTLYRDGGISLTIKVWLRNKHGVLSDVVTKTITTSTNIVNIIVAPILPTNLSKYLIQSRYTPSGSDRQKIRVQFSLPVKYITLNCEYVKLREFKLDSFTVYLTHNGYINNLLPYKNYTIQVKVTNNKDLPTEDMLVIKTWELECYALNYISIHYYSEPYDSPVILKNESFNESCIFIQWRSPSQPNGVITKYQHRYYISDNSPPQWMTYTDVQTENSYLACGYRAGDLVTYEIRAGTKVGYGPEATGDVKVTCGSCASISHYDLTIQLNEQQIFYKRYSVEETREKVLEDLDPYTNYTIILIAVNNALNKSSAEPRYITTPELAPYDGPSLSVDFDTNCAHLTIQDPTQPNGIITEYQYTCYYANSEEGNYQSILATDKQPVSLCEFRSDETVTCSAKAINSVGESPVTSQTGYTGLTVGLSNGALAFMILILVVIIIVILRRAKQFNTPTSGRETQPRPVKSADEYEVVGLSSIQQASTDVPEYAEVSVDKNPAPTYESMNTVTEDHNYEKVVHTVHNLSPNTTLYQNMQDL